MSLQVIFLVAAIITTWLMLGWIFNTVKTSLKIFVIFLIILIALQFWGFEPQQVWLNINELFQNWYQYIVQFIQKWWKLFNRRDEGVGFAYFIDLVAHFYFKLTQ